MQIFLIDLVDSTALPLEVESTFPVEKVKYKYLTQREKDKPMRSIKLTFKGKELEDDHTLEDFNVKPSSAIMVEYITAFQTKDTQTKDTQTKDTQTEDAQAKDAQTKDAQASTSKKKRIMLQVDTSTNSVMYISAFPESLALRICESIYQKQGIALKQQILMFKGTRLLPDLTLEEQGVKKGDRIGLIVRMGGS